MIMYLIYIFSCIVGFSCSNASKRNAVNAILSSKENEDSLNFLAVFMLSTLEGAHEMGGSAPRHRDFFHRVRASKETWAWPIRHYYSVIGKNQENLKILTNSSNCQNITQQHLEAMKGQPDVHEEIFVCHGIKVLYLPYCDHSSWGSKGPCCRCEGAMRYYIRMTSLYPDYPRWFQFSDDDYFMRTYRMMGVLSRFDPVLPYSVNAHANNGKVHAGTKEVERMNDSAMWRSSHNCSVPCSFGSMWLGFALFSLGAVKAMEFEINRRGLIHTCEIWKTTHDVGLGIFVWEHALSSIPLCCGSAHMNHHNMAGGTYFHGVGKEKHSDGRTIDYHDMQFMIWEYGAKLRNEEFPVLQTWVDYETSEGVNEKSVSFPAAEYENSLFYRKVQFSQSFAKQIQEDQLRNITNFPLRRTDFSVNECHTEMKFYLEWLSNNSDKYPVNERNRPLHQPKLCAAYFEAVSNTPVHLSDFNLPALDDLIRKKQ